MLLRLQATSQQSTVLNDSTEPNAPFYTRKGQVGSGLRQNSPCRTAREPTCLKSESQKQKTNRAMQLYRPMPRIIERLQCSSSNMSPKTPWYMRPAISELRFVNACGEANMKPLKIWREPPNAGQIMPHNLKNGLWLQCHIPSRNLFVFQLAVLCLTKNLFICVLSGTTCAGAQTC